MKEIRVKVCPECDTYIPEEMEDAFKYRWCPNCKYQLDKYQEMKQNVAKFAKEKHEGQFRKTDKDKKPVPYITHPLMVLKLLEMKGLVTFQYYASALLHDVVEDTDATLEEVYDVAGEEVSRIVRLLTKTKGLKTKDYIKRIKEDEVATLVKCADRIANLAEITMLKDIEYQDFKKGYYRNTVEYYSDLFKGTIFEREYIILIEKLKSQIE